MQNYQQPDTEIVAAPAAIEAISQPASFVHQQAAAEFAPSEGIVAATPMQAGGGFKLHLLDTFQQFDAQIAQFEAEVARIEQMKEQVRKQRESNLQKEQEIAIPQILAWINALNITPEQLGFAPQPMKSKAPSIPRYRDPVTQKTHSGKGGLPGWLTAETKNDPRYENPEWTAKEAAKEATKAATKNKTKTPDASVAAEDHVSNDAAAASNDAPTMSNEVENPGSESSTSQAVTNVAAIDVADTGSNALYALSVSNLN